MKKLFMFGLLAIFSLSVFAEEKKEANHGEQLAAGVCVACHGQAGNSVVSMYPKLAGQHKGYLVAALEEYRKADKGGRNNGVMVLNATNLSDEDIDAVATYYSQQKMTPGGAVEALVEKGRAIYRGGIPESGVPACLACHGPNGVGNDAAKYPKLNGQHADYLEIALKAYRSGERVNVIGNGMMNDVAKKMTDEQIKAVASYISGLH